MSISYKDIEEIHDKIESTLRDNVQRVSHLISLAPCRSGYSTHQLMKKLMSCMNCVGASRRNFQFRHDEAREEAAAGDED